MAPTATAQRPVWESRYLFEASAYSPFAGQTVSSFGWTMDVAGDVDGDGHEDVILGAQYDGTSVRSKYGSATVVSGRDGTLLWNDPGSYGSHWGSSVAGAGDVNNDGYDDVIVCGAPGYTVTVGGNPRTGVVRVLSGHVAVPGAAPEVLWRGSEAGSEFYGNSACGAGDVNGDGYADFAVGATGGSRGKVVVYSGRDGSILRTLRSTRTSSYDAFGEDVRNAGDVNRDGIDDLVVGAPATEVNGTPNLGAVFVFCGATGDEIWSVVGDAAVPALGTAVDGVGDMDGDGFPDIAAAAVGNWGGGARVYSGADGSQLGEFAWARVIRGAGDVNGDGYDDLVTGDFSYGSFGANYGRVKVIAGGPAGTWSTLVSFEDPSGSRGHAVGAGDLNGDGFGDFFFSSSSNSQGEVLVYLGRPDPAEAWHVDGVAGDELGTAIADAGDVNGDGLDDVLVGAPGAAGAQGYASVLSGADGAELYRFDGVTAGERFGTSVAGAGDVDGDGHADLLVGAPNRTVAGMTRAGAAVLFSGQTGQPLLTLEGAGMDDRFGYAVCGAGDVNADGHDDIAVGAFSDDTAFADGGMVYVYSGFDGQRLHALAAEEAGERFGFAVAGAGDVDGDGHADVLVGADLANGNAGRVALFSGATGAEIHEWLGGASGDQFGGSIDGAGDVDGDGVPDIIVGASGPGLIYGFPGGSATVFSGEAAANRGASEVIHEWFGSTSPRMYGARHVRGVGDVNGDGRDDVLIGSVYGQANGGAVQVRSGLDGGVVLQHYDSAEYLGGFGVALAGGGDTDGDGLADVLVGAGREDHGGVDNGRVYVYRLDYLSAGVVRAGIARTYGGACSPTAGKLPRISINAAPRIGTTVSIGLRGGPGTGTANLLLGPRDHLPLGALGFGSCALHVNPLLSVPALLGSNGTATMQVPLPLEPSIIGGTLACQWLTVDPSAGLGLSNGLEMTFGG